MNYATAKSPNPFIYPKSTEKGRYNHMKSLAVHADWSLMNC